MKTIAIVDYGLGNLRSVMRGLEKAGATPVITALPEEICSADGIVLPGVGAFREGMEQLGPLIAAIRESAGRVPMLGICLGMQMLMDESEEHGIHQGLRLIPGRVLKFPRVPGMKIPHMGWNSIIIEQPDCSLFDGCATEEYVYFVHSYYADTTLEHTITTTKYICPFASSIVNNMTFGVQFHPEKSGAVGLQILKNFIGLV
jgi:glutamine amidotransferase